MFNRWVEQDLLAVLADEGVGCIAFSPLAQGLLTNRYLDGVPQDSRAAAPHGFLKAEQVNPATIGKVKALDVLAKTRGQTLAQMAIAWVLRKPAMTSALIGASRISQIEDAVRALDHADFSQDELSRIDRILA
jgi:L-glyceraldehyde 3-phosphate reductase